MAGTILFSKIIAHYPDNRHVFDEIKKDCKKLVPFVGAGMSVPYYPLWPDALKQLADQLPDGSKKDTVKKMVSEKPQRLLEAAQYLEDCWEPTKMGDHLLLMFSASKIEENIDTLYLQSVYLLPYLFPESPVVTTNFDRVLETVYQKCEKKFDTRILPGSEELHNQLRQGHRHGLLKIHGDIGSEMFEYSSIIFTEAQYRQAYQPDSPVVKDLQQWFSGKMLFFLGCSLEMDNYLDLLRQIVAMKPAR